MHSVPLSVRAFHTAFEPLPIFEKEFLIDFEDDSHQRDARHSSLTDDRRAAETAHKVCTVFLEQTISTLSQTSTHVRSSIQRRYHTTSASHTPKTPKRTIFPSSMHSLKAHKPYSQIPQHTNFPKTHQKSPAQLDLHNSASHQEQTCQCCCANVPWIFFFPVMGRSTFTEKFSQ